MLRLLELSLMNVGPFNQAHIDFRPREAGGPEVTLLTGENGTGKSIVIDAIRGSFGSFFAQLERRIWREGMPFAIELEAEVAGQHETWLTARTATGFSPVAGSSLAALPMEISGGRPAPIWVADFWCSNLATDDYAIRSLVMQKHDSYLMHALQGTARNALVTELICAFDYLRDSKDAREKRAGEVLYAKTEEIIRESLLEGQLKYVRRSDFTPIVEQAGQEVPIGNLSSGNAYLIQRMLSMLGKMYSVHVLRGTEPEEIGETPGLLLIDEAENHLHPKWQKRFIPSILRVFPNLQIVAATHSPFILSSVPGARVYTCSYDREQRTCVISDESDTYASKPVDEILVSPAFAETQPFSEEISELMKQRKAAIQAGDTEARRRLEQALIEKNPESFSYFRIDQQLGEVLKGQH